MKVYGAVSGRSLAVSFLTSEEKKMSMDKNGVLNQLVPRNRWPRKPVERAGKDCPRCGAPLLKRSNERGSFLGCSKYPDCMHSECS